MDTFSRDISRRFFATEDGFEALQRHWRQMVNAPEHPPLRAEHHLLYQIARGRDYRRGFPLPTNVIKLANGQIYGCGRRMALQRIVDAVWRGDRRALDELLAPFTGTLTVASLEAMAKMLPKSGHGSVRPQELELGYVEQEVPCAFWMPPFSPTEVPE